MRPARNKFATSRRQHSLRPSNGMHSRRPSRLAIPSSPYLSAYARLMTSHTRPHANTPPHHSLTKIATILPTFSERPEERQKNHQHIPPAQSLEPNLRFGAAWRERLMGKQNSQGVLEFTFRIGDWDHCKEEANAIRPRTDASAKIRLFIAAHICFLFFAFCGFDR
jgi:hypothetical protein